MMGSCPNSIRVAEGRTAVIDVRDVGPGGAVAVGAMADHLDLVVHPFQGAVGDADPGSRHDSIEMGPEHLGELLELGSPSRIAEVPDAL